MAATVLLANIVPAAAQEEIELNNQTATFTNLHGQVFEDVQLQRATHDGLIYSSTNTGAIGMVHYADLPTNFLAKLNIPDSLVTEAARRQTALALEKQRYDEANQLLAQEQLTNNAAAALAAEPAKTAASQNAAPPPPAKNKPDAPKARHHHRRHR